MASYSPAMMAKYKAWCTEYFPNKTVYVNVPSKESHMSMLPHLSWLGWILAIGAVAYIFRATIPSLISDVSSAYIWVKSKFTTSTTTNAVATQPAA